MLLGDFMAAMLTPERDWLLLSSAHYLIMLILVLDSTPGAPACRCERVGWLRRGEEWEPAKETGLTLRAIADH